MLAQQLSLLSDDAIEDFAQLGLITLDRQAVHRVLKTAARSVPSCATVRQAAPCCTMLHRGALCCNAMQHEAQHRNVALHAATWCGSCGVRHVRWRWGQRTVAGCRSASAACNRRTNTQQRTVLQRAALLQRVTQWHNAWCTKVQDREQPVPRETVAISTRRRCAVPRTQAATPLCVGRTYRHPS